MHLHLDHSHPRFMTTTAPRITEARRLAHAAEREQRRATGTSKSNGLVSWLGRRRQPGLDPRPA